jgi:hypothetical protein
MQVGCRINISDMEEEISSLRNQITNVILKKAAAAGGEVVKNQYQAALMAITKRPGTYKSAQGVIENFIRAYEAVTQRTLLFKDRTGAYSVVGIEAAPGKWQPLSPQAMWLESGADGSSQSPNLGHRYHTTDNASTGVEEPRHTLANIADTYQDIIAATMQQVVIEELANYVA